MYECVSVSLSHCKGTAVSKSVLKKNGLKKDIPVSHQFRAGFVPVCTKKKEPTCVDSLFLFPASGPYFLWRGFSTWSFQFEIPAL